MIQRITRRAVAAFLVWLVSFNVVVFGKQMHAEGWLQSDPWIALAILGVPTVVAIVATWEMAAELAWRHETAERM